MTNTGIEFIEDKKILRPLEKEHEIKGASIEGWIQKKFPGKRNMQIFILLLIILLLFSFSILFLILSYSNFNKEKMEKAFEEKIYKTKLK